MTLLIKQPKTKKLNFLILKTGINNNNKPQGNRLKQPEKRMCVCDKRKK